MSNGRLIKLTPLNTPNYQIHLSNKSITAQIIQLHQIFASASSPVQGSKARLSSFNAVELRLELSFPELFSCPLAAAELNKHCQLSPETPRSMSSAGKGEEEQDARFGVVETALAAGSCVGLYLRLRFKGEPLVHTQLILTCSRQLYKHIIDPSLNNRY